MCTRYPIINRVSELKVHIELTRFVQPEKIEIDANERAVNEKSPYCFFVCTTFDSFLNDLPYIGLKLFPTWSEVKFLKFHTPKDNSIPIWDEVKIPRFITFRQVVEKFFCKNQSPAECRGLMRNLNLIFGATCT